MDSFNYEVCSCFNNNHEHKNLCLNLNDLGQFLYKELGLQKFIDGKLSTMGQIEDLNHKYQKPLKLLFETGKFKNIEWDGLNNYYLKSLSKVNTLYDEDGGWSYVNKLNTNYSDLAELLTELFIRGGVVNKLSSKNIIGLKKYLLTIKDRLPSVLDKYFELNEYKIFVRNTKRMSEVGENSEEIVKKVLEEFGMKTLYQGGHGDHIDMLFGSDLIVEYKGKPRLIQIKTTEKQLTDSLCEKRYRNIDYFASPTNFGVLIKHSSGRSLKLRKNGTTINDTN